MLEQFSPLYPAIPARQQLEKDLLSVLLQAEDAIYPWNPSDAATDRYFESLQQDFAWDDDVVEQVNASANIFFGQVDQLFANQAPAISPVESLRTTLASRFATAIPQAILATIAQKAQDVVNQNLSRADQLVQIVQEVMPHWSIDDLLVPARPFAYAMRSHTPHEAAQAEVSGHWDELNDLERAKLGFLVALCAVSELEQQD
jgi:hypothetical protein